MKERNWRRRYLWKGWPQAEEHHRYDKWRFLLSVKEWNWGMCFTAGGLRLGSCCCTLSRGERCSCTFYWPILYIGEVKIQESAPLTSSIAYAKAWQSILSTSRGLPKQWQMSKMYILWWPLEMFRGLLADSWEVLWQTLLLNLKKVDLNWFVRTYASSASSANFWCGLHAYLKLWYCTPFYAHLKNP